jgi:hypothetical protein
MVEEFSSVRSRANKARQEWDPGFWWADLVLPFLEAHGHFCIVGSPGSGKTVLVRMLMESVLPSVGAQSKIPALPAEPQRVLSQIVWDDVPGGNQKGQTKEKPSFRNVWAPVSLLLVASGFIAHNHLAPVSPTAQWFESSHGLASGAAAIALILGVTHFLHRGRWVVAVQVLALLLVGAGLFWFQFAIHAAVIAALALTVPVLARPEPPYIEPTLLPEVEPQSPLPRTVQYRNPAYDEWYQKTRSWPQLTKPHRAFIYDGKLEASGILRSIPGFNAPVFNMDPFHDQGYAWNLAKDIDGATTAIQIASILIPEEKNATNRFFPEAARALMAATFRALHYLKPGDWTFRDAILILKNKNRLSELLKRCPETVDDVETFLSGQRDSVGDVMATIGVKIALYEPIAALWERAATEGRSISLSDWINSESVLLVANDKARNSSLDAINRAIFNRAVELLLSENPHDFQPNTLPGRTWFFLDEAREAGILEKLTSLMTTGRQYGACVVMAFQDIEGMRASFGEKEANEITGLCSYKAFLRMDSPQTAAWASEVLGEYEAEVRKVSVTKGDNKSRSTSRSFSDSGFFGPKTVTNSESHTYGDSGSSTEASEKMVRKAALASEFMELPKADRETGVTGYFISPYGTCMHTVNRFPSGQPRFDRSEHIRPVTDQSLKPWSDWDSLRLRIAKPKSVDELLKEKQRRSRQRP